MQQAAPVRLYGKRGCPAAYAIRDFLHRSDIPFEWIELRDDEHARKELGVENVDDSRLPICIFGDGTRIERPSVRQITEKLGWFRNPSRSEYDLAIYGAGPAGLSASVYGASEGLKTVLVERLAVGGQAATSPKIENYLDFPEGISGADLAERAREQASRFGTEILIHRAGVRGEFNTCKGLSISTTGPRSSLASPSAPRAWSTVVLAYQTRKSSSALASIMGLAQAKPNFVATSTSSSWVRAILLHKPRCTLPATLARSVSS